MTTAFVQKIQSGKANKPFAGIQTIVFPAIFLAPPVVVVTPVYDQGCAQINNTPTVLHVDEEKFTVRTENGGLNFYISWIAIGC